VYSVGMAGFRREIIQEIVRNMMRGADLREAKLSEAKLFGALYSTDTIWPEGFDPVAAAAVLVED